MRPSARRLIKLGMPAVGLALFVLILFRMDWTVVGRILDHAELPLAAASVAVLIGVLVAKGLRHYCILRCQQVDISVRSAMIAYFQSSFWGFMSPGRLGDFSRILYLRDYAVSNRQSLVNTLLDKLLDLTCLMLLIPLLLLPTQLPGKMEITAVALLGLAGVVLTLSVARMLPERRLGTVALSIRNLLLEMAAVRRKVLLLGLAVAIWLVYFGGMYLFAASIGIDEGFSFVSFSVAASNVVAILPVSVAGIGTRDILLVTLFRLRELPLELAVVFSGYFLLLYVVNIAFCSLFLVLGPVSGRSRQPRS
jgi:glycosyltransferase 2 family protein